MKLSFLLLKLGQKIRGGAEVTTGIARRVLRWTVCLLWLETIAICEANSIQIVANVFQLKLLLVAQLFGINHLWTPCYVDAYSSFGKGLFPFLTHGRIKDFRVDQGHLR